VKKLFTIVDMFCGAGGESTGIMQAAQEQDMDVSLFAINHWEKAIDTHSANYPMAEHLCQSVEHIDPVKVIPGQKLDLLWASPECTHHSNARGGRPRSEQGRASAWLILKWLSELYVERVIVENVPEFLSWGPLDTAGKPIKPQKGKTFKAFAASIRSMGYTVDWRVLCAADYGDPTTRKRLFIQAVRFRMLKRRELMRAHSFPDNYVLKGNSAEQVRQIGNSVPVKLAKALAKAAIYKV